MHTLSRLILGGHSFIAPLGSDPLASDEEQKAIVAACVARGITTVDTTYAPERVAFARALPMEPGRPTPLIWNFFGPLTEPLPGPMPWTAAGLAEALAELSPWAGKPVVVLHAVRDEEANRQQIEDVLRWKREGVIAAAGIWTGNPQEYRAPGGTPWDFAVYPWNPSTAVKHRPLFEAARTLGLATVATSPFLRGWELDRLTTRLCELESVAPNAARARVADLLLRFSLFAPEVDHLIVAMRSARYVEINLASADRGPLGADELRMLTDLGAFP